MIELTKLLIGIAVFLVIFILIISGKARTLVSAFFNLFVEDLASTPEGAEALFAQKEDKIRESFYKADEVFKKVAGQKKRCAEELAQLKNNVKLIESSCEKLAASGDEESLDIKIRERSDIIDDIKLHEKTLVELEGAYKAAFEARRACEENLENISKKKKQVIGEMKRNRDMKQVYDDLEGIGANDHTTRLLDKVVEKSQDMDDMVEGSKVAYETKTSTKVKQVERKLKVSEDDAYKQELLKKFNKK